MKDAGLSVSALPDVAIALEAAVAQAADATRQAVSADQAAANGKSSAADIVRTASSIASKAC